jgi:acetoin utilization protein AcuB
MRGARNGAQTVRTVLDRRTRAVSPDLKATDALGVMREEKLDHLVVYSGKTVLGIASRRDLEERTLGLKPLGQVISARPPCASPETTLSEAAELLRGRSIGCLPVLERNQLVGVVTASALLDALRATVRK